MILYWLQSIIFRCSHNEQIDLCHLWWSLKLCMYPFPCIMGFPPPSIHFKSESDMCWISPSLWYLNLKKQISFRKLTFHSKKLRFYANISKFISAAEVPSTYFMFLTLSLKLSVLKFSWMFNTPPSHETSWRETNLNIKHLY